MQATEIAQLYIRDRVGSITRPIKELKGFQRLSLKPGETITATFQLNAVDLQFFNGSNNVIEPGEFDVWVGTDSNSGLHAEFIIE